MNFWRTAGLVAACAAAVVASGCVRTSDGLPVAASSVAGQPSASPRASIPNSTGQADQPPPGIVPTLQVPVPANTVTCAPDTKPPVSVVAAVDDKTAPRVTVGVPEGWSFTGGSGDVGVRMTGPDGMSAIVSIAPTALDPEAAFREYTDKIMEKSAVSSVSVLPAELCEYSGQKLMGAWSDTPQNSVEFYDRVAHVWTNTTNYLIAVHVEAPTGVDAVDGASAVITDHIEIAIP
jgi:hypothetical protein